jgi:hypothetical protein
MPEMDSWIAMGIFQNQLDKIRILKWQSGFQVPDRTSHSHWAIGLQHETTECR